ncbi:hypothetical protein BDV41DRAFT_568936 [Aspergillus transmontanensis]|uniref:Uncharacterized protein n=1 Tax=Aspergillus transmontanensis TaxID=1034304 RepID=A0A5N6VGD8_9EURO|nr:hypothetical protein BDV41DRAFT_568936 [Aspergillus transmontanensis]
MSYHTTEPSKRVRRFLPKPIETTTRKSETYQPISYVGRKLQHERDDLNTAEGGKENTKSHSTRPTTSTKSLINIKLPASTASEIDGNSPTDLPSNSYLGRRHFGEKHATESRGLLRQSGLSGKQNEPFSNADNSQLRPRKFVPQLMETASRSFRRDSSPHAPHDTYRLEPETENLRHRSVIGDTPAHAEDHLAHESRFSYSRLRQRQETRRHSFRVPDLPMIPSSGSEASEVSDLSLPVSPSACSRQSVIRPKVEEDRRESCDELFSSYLLSLAARSAEKQLREQALAAFPNEQVYQPVDHFAIDREEDCTSQGEPVIPEADDVLTRYRRASSADLSWELEYMRQHKEEAEMRDRAMAGTQGLHRSSVAPSKIMACSQLDNPDKSQERDHKFGQQRHVKSPPMLGDDLIFPQSLSPKTTFCENSHLAECNNSIHNFPSLWHAAPHHNDHCGRDGLWMGTCKRDKHCRNPQDSLSCSTLASVSQVKGEGWVWPNGMLTSEDKAHLKPRKKLELPDEKDRGSSDSDTEPQLQDGFVTQIYNYLSLGYPCVAHLRRDDMNTDARGYVSVAENSGTGTSVSEVCMRWLALRSYIREWARQQPITAEDNSSHGTWGVRERRGSWAG